MHSIQEIANIQRLMTFSLKIEVFFHVENSIMITEIWENYHWMQNEISQKIAVSDFSFENIFFWN